MDKIRVYSIVRFLTSFALGTILPVYVLYFRHYQINLFQIAMLAAIFEASIFRHLLHLLSNPFGIYYRRDIEWTGRDLKIRSSGSLVGGLIET
ncbi:hypothetical protein AMJ44_15130 [candidate division WOR-1 bacterium DG_54_3]|uniref:Uncharacterized protein n=1 Tax=candidate division WOR-1 bacterium DG_54_3 TaxID=1703775 RepID=A0A0S7XJZ0_UNCSA|nr:MAG: hypothetical protein AMJ44_15130 [candidate division WOR-1 bacterium DG_54_3]